jgi:hypothetical protein
MRFWASPWPSMRVLLRVKQGTLSTPLQSEQLFQAIRGNGRVVRLVMLPHEPHWYAAMESNEQLAYEELR